MSNATVSVPQARTLASGHDRTCIESDATWKIVRIQALVQIVWNMASIACKQNTAAVYIASEQHSYHFQWWVQRQEQNGYRREAVASRQADPTSRVSFLFQRFPSVCLTICIRRAVYGPAAGLSSPQSSPASAIPRLDPRFLDSRFYARFHIQRAHPSISELCYHADISS